MGLRPVGLVQGFCVMQWGWYGAGSPYTRGMTPYAFGGDAPAGRLLRELQLPPWRLRLLQRAPHLGPELPAALGRVRLGPGLRLRLHRAWSKKPREVGAHGVIGVVDTTRHLADMNVTEFHILGTAVVVEDAAAPPGRRAVDDVSGGPASGQARRGRLHAGVGGRRAGLGAGVGVLRHRDAHGGHPVDVRGRLPAGVGGRAAVPGPHRGPLPGTRARPGPARQRHPAGCA